MKLQPHVCCCKLNATVTALTRLRSNPPHCPLSLSAGFLTYQQPPNSGHINFVLTLAAGDSGSFMAPAFVIKLSSTSIRSCSMLSDDWPSSLMLAVSWCLYCLLIVVGTAHIVTCERDWTPLRPLPPFLYPSRHSTSLQDKAPAAAMANAHAPAPPMAALQQEDGLELDLCLRKGKRQTCSRASSCERV